MASPNSSKQRVNDLRFLPFSVSLPQGLEIRVDEYSDGSLMDEVMQLMLQAHDWDQATSGPGGQGSDADVQIVLGVLYNVSHDYDSATAAFRQALLSRPR